MDIFLDFLLARIWEDEAALDCGVNDHDGATHEGSPTSLTCSCDFRAKREAKAKRAMIAEHRQSPAGEFCYVDEKDYPCQSLRLIALSYAGHADYRSEWKPFVLTSTQEG